MGNKIARTTQAAAGEYYLHDLPSAHNLVLLDVACRGRFLKSAVCKHDEGLILLKVYFKRGDPVQLQEHGRQLERIRDIFQSIHHSHVWPFQLWFETDKAAYLLRQYFYSNLHDRLSMRPFLSLIEKKWLAFQLLCAVEQCHSKGICHGDIKCENVLVTSWNWLYLADFASFKPTYIPHDDPSDFSFFFDTGGRRTCYLAPERFYEHGGESQFSQDSPLKPSMDIFSIGCVIAELFLEGQPLFEFSQILAYRRGQYDPRQSLEKIQDLGIRSMILHMIQLDPGLRLPCEGYLQNYGSVIFPKYFSFLHKFFSCIIPLDPDNRVTATQGSFRKIYEQLTISNSCDTSTSESGRAVPNDSRSFEDRESVIRSSENLTKSKSKVGMKTALDHLQLSGDLNILLQRVEARNRKGSKNTEEYIHSSGAKGLVQVESLNEEMEHNISGLMGLWSEGPHMRQILRSDLPSIVAGYNSQSETYNFDYFLGTEFKVNIEGMVLIASLLCSCIRSVKHPQIRRAGVLLLKASSLYIGDDERLQHVIPVVVALVNDPSAMVRCAVLETLSDILALVREFPPSDSMIFPEYIIPMLSSLQVDPEESVRICYASNIHKIAISAYRFYVQSRGFAASLDAGADSRGQLISTESAKMKNYDQSGIQLANLRRVICDIVQKLVIEPRPTPTVRRAFLADIGHMCYFLGEKQSNEFLLPILPAFLNDRDDQLRAAFFGQIVFVCYFVGRRSVEEYLLPYLEQALSDEMETVIVNVLECLSMLCRNNYLGKSIIINLINKVLPLLLYPLRCVRKSAVTFITACNESLGPVDSFVYLARGLHSYLQREPPSLSSEAYLLSCLNPPISSKSIFYEGLEKVESSDMLGRQRKIWYNSSTYSNQGGTTDQGKLGGETSVKISGSSETAASGKRRMSATSESNLLTISENIPKARASSTSQSLNVSEKSLFAGSPGSYSAAGNRSCYGPLKEIPLYSGYIDRRNLGAMSMASDSSMQGNMQNLQASFRTPWSESAIQPGSLSSSAPPKIVQGSYFHITSSSIQGGLSGNSQDHKGSGSSSSINSKVHDIALVNNSSVTEDVSQFDMTALPSSSRGLPFSDAGWKPRGTLVAHLQEHRMAINSLALANDNSFFVSVSDDSTVKIWETKKLEKDISFRSRLTYALGGGRALCATIVRGTAQVVAGSSDGELHLISIERPFRGDRSSGIADVKKRDIAEGAIHSIVNCSPSDGWINQTVLYSTENCGMHIWDTRLSSDSWTFKSKPEEGHISSLVMGSCGNWFVSGSSRGTLTLWDVRFLLPVYSWQHTMLSRVESMCLLMAATDSFSGGGQPLIYVASGCNEVSLWNAENGTCHQVFRTAGIDNEAQSSNVHKSWPRLSSKKNSKQDMKRSAISTYRIDELNEPPPCLPGIRSLLPLPGGDLLTGGTDLKIRYWDHSSPDRSYCVVGPLAKGLSKDESYDIRSNFGIQCIQEVIKRPMAARSPRSLHAVAATDAAGCHRDAVLSMASIKLNQRLLISSSRDGAIKVWK